MNAFLLAILLPLVASAAWQEEADPPAQAVVEPTEITAGMFYDGASVRVRAPVPVGADVVILARGEDVPLTLRRKGKALGLLWMNVGDVSWGRVPGLYLLHGSSRLELAPAPELERLGIGYPALRTCAQPGPGADTLFNELVRLREKDGFWAVAMDAVDIRTVPDGTVASTDLSLPVKAPPASYRVLVYAFEAGHGRLVASGTFTIRQGGVPAFITSLAARHGLLYGILAVLIAVAVGLLTGVAFGLGSRKGH